MNKIQSLIGSLVVIGTVLGGMSGCDNFGLLDRSCGFEFDMRFDDQHAAVLDYKLVGESNVIDEVEEDRVNKGVKIYGESIGTQYVRPVSLYVKWQDEITGVIYKETVNLKPVLPNNLEGTVLYFIIHGAQINVYLKLNKPHSQNSQSIGSSIYAGYENLQLFPRSINSK